MCVLVWTGAVFFKNTHVRVDKALADDFFHNRVV